MCFNDVSAIVCLFKSFNHQPGTGERNKFRVIQSLSFSRSFIVSALHQGSHFHLFLGQTVMLLVLIQMETSYLERFAAVEDAVVDVAVAVVAAVVASSGQ